MRCSFRPIAAVGAFIACASLVGCSGGAREPGVELQVLALEPITPEARPISAADLKGKVTLINFWATWCPPCIAEFPHLLRIADGFRNDADFQFLSVATGHPTVADVRDESTAFLKENGYQIPVWADVDMRTQKGLPGNVDAIPVTVLVDRDAKIAKLIVGFDAAQLDQLQLQIASMLQAKP